MPRPVAWMLAILMAFLAGCAARHESEPRYYQTETASKPYQDVLAELELAITERNFRITGHNKIGSVIRERDNIEFPDYDAVQFCNLTLARKLLEISPAAIVYMPCNVTIRADQGKVIVTTHLLPTDSANPRLNDFARQMNEQLKQIADFAVDE